MQPQLQLSTGDRLMLTEAGEIDGHFKGRHSGTNLEGWFPADAVRPVPFPDQELEEQDVAAKRSPAAPSPEMLEAPSAPEATDTGSRAGGGAAAEDTAAQAAAAAADEAAGEPSAVATQWGKYMDPETGRVWMCRKDEQEYFFIDTPPRSWVVYMDDTSRRWWFNNETLAWFYEPSDTAA